MKAVKNKIRFEIIFLFTLMLLFNFGVSKVTAQTFPLAGATWIFKENNPIWKDNLAQKWEYISDSISVDGIIKKMKVTTKVVNPEWIPFDTTTVNEEYQYFLFVGDTIWNTNDSLSPVANFSLQVGDSAYTPYHSTFSSLYPLIMDSLNNCSQEAQSLFFQKGIVVETDIEAENNINYRIYKLKFIDELGDTIIRKFSERTILTEDYWHYNNVFFSSCSATDFPIFSFLCYKDDFSTSSTCSDIEWFESLNIGKEEQILKLEIFPNPTSEYIKIKTNNLGSFTLNVYDIIGKSKITKDIYFNGKNELILDVSGLEVGAYLVEITSNNVRLTSRFIKN
jgi:hypothetical protein